MKKIFLFFLFMISLQLQGVSKNKQIDSLLSSLGKSGPDTVKLITYKKILDVCELNDNPRFAQQAVNFADTLMKQTTDSTRIKIYLKYKATYLQYFSYYYSGKKNPDNAKAIAYYQKMLTIEKQIGNTNGMVSAYNGSRLFTNG